MRVALLVAAAVLLATVSCASESTAPTGQVLGVTSNASQDRVVLAFYYPWYDADSFERASARPSRPYNSDDPAVITRHVEQAKASGIDAFVSGWFGKGDRTDANFAKLLDIAAARGFSATIYFETDTILGEGTEAIVRELANFYQTYGSHPAILRYQDRPVIFFWRTRALPLREWSRIRDVVDADRSGVWIAEGDVFTQLEGDTFDGIHPYSIAWSATPARTLASYGQRTRQHPGKLWVPTAMPGYDDTRITAAPEGFARARDDGSYYRASFQGAIDSNPSWAIMIASWNEWLEGHQIEPGVGYGELYLDLTREYAQRFKDG